MDHLARAFVFIRGALVMLGNGLEELWKMALRHKVATAIVAVILVGAVVAASVLIFEKPASIPTDDRREVTVVTVGDVSKAEPLSVIGEVRSRREAQVAPDTSGTVVAVYRSLGDAVGAGTIIAELKNDSQRAAVAQAKAALDKAKSATAIGSLGVESAATAFATAEASAASAISSAYATIDDAITRKTDAMFTNPSTAQLHFNVSVSNSQLAYNVETKRLAVRTIQSRQRASLGDIPTDADAQIVELTTLSSEATVTADYLATLTSALSGAITTALVSEATLAGYRADASAALASINALRSSLAATIQDLKLKRSSVVVAKQGVQVGATGATADIAAAEAGLSQAETQLEKTLIRAPIAGSISRLEIHVGNFVNASVPLIYITNQSGLEVVTYVSAGDLAAIAVGGRALIEGGIEGTVVRVASALDPVTKKAELRVGLPPSSGLVSGESVTLALTRSYALGTRTLSIPLSALKITPDGPKVFTVSATHVLEAHPVVLGSLRGSTVEIVEGVGSEMAIVEDARGLKEGQTVIVK